MCGAAVSVDLPDSVITTLPRISFVRVGLTGESTR